MTFDSYSIRNRYKKNPLLSQFSSSVPTDIKDMFKWMEFIIYNAPVAAAGLKKLSETPITSFKYITDGDNRESTTIEDSSWKNIVEKDIRLKAVMLDISYNTLLYGNQFISVYTPFSRMLLCKKCNNMIRIEDSQKLKVKLRTQDDDNRENSKKQTDSKDLTKKYKKLLNKNTSFVTTVLCEKCKSVQTQEIIDTPVKNASKINIIKWNPYNIEISTNSVSGKSIYYYRPEASIISGIKQGDPEIINALPFGMIEAVLKNKVFRFAENHLYHLKKDTVSGIGNAWGMPALAAAIPAFLNTMILRKANEKIATDYMVPLRVMYPSQPSNQGEVYNYISGGDFVGKINSMVDKWKLDPSAVQTAPFPIGVQSILGDGKMLSVYQELEMAESSIANTLGIPIEFIKGGLSYAGQGASLRLLENQMGKVSSALNECIDFIVQKVGHALNKKTIKIEMIPFKIIDDIQEKAAIVQLASQGAGVSKGTLMEIFNMDAKSEAEKLSQEARDGIIKDIEISKFQQEEANSAEERARAQDNMNGGNFETLNQTALLNEADMQANQIAGMDYSQKRSTLDEMSKTNYILYSVVKARLDMIDNKGQGQGQGKGQQ